jgi:FAD/FMN-containing dehydrogenase
MIDLTSMGGVRVDPTQRRAWVQGGALLGVLDQAAQEHGLATTAGNVSHTGVGGLTLGGGMGWLARQHGLSCDNVAAFEMVTAEGTVVRASDTDNPDLYWGLRGGGGNFGIVTEFEFRLHPTVGQALVADFFFPLDEAPSVLGKWRDLNACAPREATFTAAVGEFQAAELRGRPVASVGFVWVGDAEPGRQLVPTLRRLGHPVAERVVELPYLALQRMDDNVEGHAFRRYWKGHYFRELPDEAIEMLVLRGTASGHGEQLPNMSLQAHGGAIADVADADTAFSHRDTLFELVAGARWSDPAEDESRMATARRSVSSLDRFASGVYVNALSDEGAAGVRRAFPPAKLARLTALKDLYDPENMFHLNQNIQPSVRRQDQRSLRRSSAGWRRAGHIHEDYLWES